MKSMYNNPKTQVVAMKGELMMLASSPITPQGNGPKIVKGYANPDWENL